MTGDVVVLCRPDVADGFRLAGLEPVRARDAEEATDRLEELRSERDPGVLLVDAVLWDELPERIRAAVEAVPLPMVVPFPPPAWAERPAGEEYIVELLRRSIGYRVKLR